MKLLKASLTSPTPLSDLILDKTTVHHSTTFFESLGRKNQIEIEGNPKSKKIVLKALVEKNSGKLLFAKAKEDFVDFLFSLLVIPLGDVEHLLAGKSCFKAIDNLYGSTSVFLDEDYFKSPDKKERLMKPNLPHGCISENHIFPLTEECLPPYYNGLQIVYSSSNKFSHGKGIYLHRRSQTYQVKDDLTVTPFCFVSILCSLKQQKIPISDVEEVELQIGLKEGLSILKASLTSTSALTDALLNHTSNKPPKTEV